MKTWNIIGWIMVALNTGLIIWDLIENQTVNIIALIIVIVLVYLLWKNYKIDKEEKEWQKEK